MALGKFASMCCLVGLSGRAFEPSERATKTVCTQAHIRPDKPCFLDDFLPKKLVFLTLNPRFSLSNLQNTKTPKLT
jgi:hypothetical protein